MVSYCCSVAHSGLQLRFQSLAGRAADSHRGPSHQGSRMLLGLSLKSSFCICSLRLLCSNLPSQLLLLRPGSCQAVCQACLGRLCCFQSPAVNISTHTGDK